MDPVLDDAMNTPQRDARAEHRDHEEGESALSQSCGSSQVFDGFSFGPRYPVLTNDEDEENEDSESYVAQRKPPEARPVGSEGAEGPSLAVLPEASTLPQGTVDSLSPPWRRGRTDARQLLRLKSSSGVPTNETSRSRRGQVWKACSPCRCVKSLIFDDAHSNLWCLRRRKIVSLILRRKLRV
jgi:hypothetical protein